MNRGEVRRAHFLVDERQPIEVTKRIDKHSAWMIQDGNFKLLKILVKQMLREIP
jgi:hypothetical protein